MKQKVLLFTCTLFITFCALAQVPSANFTAPVRAGCSPVVVNFQDQSTGNPTSWLWDFGTGATSTLQNPSTTYFNPGTYTVRLTATNANGSNTITRTQFIEVYEKPEANFTVNDSVGCFPHRATFTDLSTAGLGSTNVEWFWDFGNGTQSTAQNPTVTYTNTGNYTVTLKVTNDKGCSRVLTKQQYIRITGGFTSGFTNTQPAICKPPVTVAFSNTTTGPGTLSYVWDFGDGSTATQPNPVHTYTTGGSFTVTLTILSSEGCTDTVRKTNAVVVLDPNTSFTAPASACVLAPVSFQNASTPAPQGSTWDFGDGTTGTGANPAKAYTTPGTYTVKLFNNYGTCTDSSTRTITINPRPTAAFAATTPRTRCQPDLPVSFSDASSGAVSWSWTFGDGTVSTLQNPSHTYTTYGAFDVQLVVTNAFGCTDTLRRPQYVQIQRPVITLVGLPVQGCIPYTITPSAVISTLDAVSSYLWDFGDGTTSTAAAPSHTYPNQGTYTVRLTITTSTGCTETATSSVRVGRKPIINFSSVPNPVCAFKPVQFTDGTNEADQWLWLFGDGTSSTVQNPIHTYNDTGTLDVTLIAINNGCPDTLRRLNYITVRPPIAKFVFQPNCANRMQFQFRDTSVGATSWLWDFGDGTTSTQQHPVHTFPAFGSYPVKLTVFNGGCDHSVTRDVLVFNEKPAFTADVTTACKTAYIVFSATSGNLNNIANYFWDAGNGSQYSGSGIPAVQTAYAVSGLYTVSLITTDLYGCRDTVTKPNYIKITGPSARYNLANTRGCKGLTTTFTDVSFGDGFSPITSRTWDFGDGVVQTFTSNTGPIQHTFASAGTFTVKLVVRDASGCSDSTILQGAVITSDPKALFTADTLTCPGAPVAFGNTSTSSDPTTWQWSFGDGNTSSLQAPTHAYAANGVYTVKLFLRDQYGCADSLTRPAYITVNRPVASYTVSDSASSCTPFEVVFTNTSQYYNSSMWNLGGGTSTLTSPTQFYTLPGVYQTYLAITSPGGCVDTARQTIRVYDTTGTNLTYLPLDGCKPLPVDLNTNTRAPHLSYIWDFGDGVIVKNGVKSINHIYDAFGDFVPKVILTDSSGCIIPITGLDTIRIIGATAKFGYDKKFFCDSGYVLFTDSTTFNDPITSYTWDFTNGSSSVRRDSIRVGFLSPGIYSASLAIRTLQGCTDTMTLTDIVKVVESPLIDIAGRTEICINDTLQHAGLFVRPDTSVVKWSWQFPNGSSSTLQNPAVQKYGVAGTFNITTVATNSSGCTDTDTIRLLVNPLPVITLPSPLTKVVGTPLTLPATYTNSIASYLWSNSATLNCSNCPQPVTTTKFNATYAVSVVDTNGCTNRAQVEVIVTCKGTTIFLPNTFSPNSDGVNDMFYARGTGLDRVKSLRIFNRWGEVVFEQRDFPINNATFGWNGMYKGKKALPDVYVYQVEIFCENSELLRFEGNISLIQ